MLRRSERILNERSSMGTIEKLRHLIGVLLERGLKHLIA